MPSIIVPARNNAEMTASCLATILYSVNRLHLQCEFILVDDASETGEEILRTFREHREKAIGHVVKIIRSRKHQHYSGVFSLGLHHATRQLVFFISNDMFVTPTFIEALLLVSAMSPEIGIVRGTSNYTDSHPEHRVEPKQKMQTYQDVESFSRHVFGSMGCRYVEDVILSGDAILLKRSLIDRIGVLDLRFFGYFGDLDYGIRARQAGFKLVCAKGAWLYHEGSGHVKREAIQHALAFDDVWKQRMGLVEVAYQEFRKRWNIAAPESWDSGAAVNPLQLLEQANAHADPDRLKYEFPASALGELEFH